MNISQAGHEELLQLRTKLREEYEGFKSKGLKLDMSRGKPCPEQLDLSEGLLSAVKDNSAVLAGGVDTRNYGGLDGLSSCRALFAALLEVPVDNVIAGGNSSLTMMYDTMMRLFVFGAPGVDKPWAVPPVRFLCPAPGYDRHFAITQQLGIEMIVVPMRETGPDMDVVERLVRDDPSIKGIWCVPKYSNPQGVTYSDETVRRFAALKPAAPDFRIFWDNAYCVHDLTDTPDTLLNLFEESRRQGTEDRVLIFASTSKITYPGAGVAAMAASEANIRWTKRIMSAQAIGPDKVNQSRHVLFFKDADGVRAHMRKHRAILAPRFAMVTDTLEREIGGTGVGSWHTPRGGYFVSFDALPGCANTIFNLCKAAGLVMTDAGATFPYGRDPEDKNLRIAPSFPSLGELETAMKLFCVCVKLAAVEKLLAN